MPCTLTTSVPYFVSPEERRSIVGRTPASFNEIPPVLRHREDNVSITIDPPLEGFSAEDAQKGSLYVIESALVFISETGQGFQVEYPAITLHAVSRTEAGPSIYCQIDESTGVEVSADREYTDLRELTLVPQNPDALDSIFEALSFCASLHPDPTGPSHEDDMDDAFIDSSAFEQFDGDADQELSEAGRAALQHLESIIVYPEGVPCHSNEHASESEQFADAEPKVNGAHTDKEQSNSPAQQQ
ncbi:hypothetical protein FISHEDRAFT_51941 [Fistulina hepatica ATCC 64428]|nr:hypothetical protein FISHEDRAFT_51941 [Fistulina hepatica ATCC 64428]